jgi:mono/diheme cytochrome c family protein
VTYHAQKVQMRRIRWLSLPLVIPLVLLTLATSILLRSAAQDPAAGQTLMHGLMASLERPASFELMDAGLAADAPSGQLLMVEKKCVACHGTAGPVGGFQRRNEVPTKEVVIAQLRTPRNRMPIFTADQASDVEAGSIVEFLVSQLSPEGLPQTGDKPSPTIWPIAMLVLAAGLLLLGLGLRARRFVS